jgi:tyrocidine synthetase-3
MNKRMKKIQKPISLDKEKVEEIFPLTAVQQGMLYHFLKDPGSCIYFEQLTMGVSGEIKQTVFEEAWNQVVRDNEMLRTVFRWENVKNPLQLVLKTHHLKPLYYDLTQEEPGNQEKRLEQIKISDRNNPFDLMEVPFRVTCCKTGKKNYTIIISHHHILFDGWSYGIVLKEFFEAYDAFYCGSHSFTKPQKKKFKEVISEDTSTNTKENQHYWASCLKGFPTLTENNFHKREKNDLKKIGHHLKILSKELREKVQQCVRENKITIATFMYSAWGLLLQDIGNIQDVIFDTTVSTRDEEQTGIQDLVGLFINTLPLRIQLKPGITKLQLLKQIQEQLIERKEHEKTLPKLIKEMKESLSIRPLDTLMVIENYPLDHILNRENSRLKCHTFSIEEITGYDMTVILTMVKDWEVRFSYHTDKIDQEMVTLIGQHLQKIIETISESPENTIKKISVPGLILKKKKLKKSEPTSQEVIPPANEGERKLQAIWSDVLKVKKEEIGTDQEFFDLGGHSLKVSMLLSRIHEVFDVKISWGELFAYPYIRQLSVIIQGAPRKSFTSITPIEKKDYYPLSPTQKRIYALQELDPESTAYNVTTLMEIQGQMNREDYEIFETIFRKLINRHESLKTYFKIYEHQVVCQIEQPGGFALQTLELKQGQTIKEVTQNFVRSFDLAKAPLIRVCLMKTGATGHVLLVDLHHIITDAFSMDTFIKEFSRLHQGEELKPLKIQYRDVTEWRENTLQSKEWQSQEQYWSRIYPGELPVLNMTTDFPRPKVQSFEGKQQGFIIGKKLTQTLRQFIREHESTLFIALLSVCNVILSRYASQEDIIMGTTIAGREHVELEEIIGLFIETMALRNFPQGEKTFREFHREVRKNTLEAFENSAYPFKELIEKVGDTSDLSRNPLFSVMLILQNVDIAPLNLKGLTCTSCESHQGTSKVDITLEVFEKEEDIQVQLEYCTRLFKPDTMKRFSSHFLNILKEVLGEPGIRLADLQMLSLQEKKQLETEFRTSRVEPGSQLAQYIHNKYASTQLCVHHLFEKQAEKSPNDVAVVYESFHLTYQEIEDKSNLLSAHICREIRELKEALGLIPVGIMANDTPALIAGIVGVLKSGNSFVPLNPQLPDERIQFILQDCGISLFLVDRDNDEQLKEIADLILLRTRVMCIDEMIDPADSPAMAGEHKVHPDVPSEIPEQENENELPCYTIYTSGSTGQPKGVQITQRNLLPLLYWGMDFFNIGIPHRVMHNLSYTFDFGVFEIFITLITGGCLFMQDKRDIRGNEDYIEFINLHKINTLHSTPTFFSSMMEIEKPMRTLKILHLGGEVIPGKMVRQLSKLVSPECTLYNGYGPTETTVNTTIYSLEVSQAIDWEPGKGLPIGRPSSLHVVYILDHYLNEQPIGAAGELFISGEGLSPGYINRPQLTHERFIQNSYRKGEKLYRTGDLVKWNFDGNIEFLGRIDHQVKVRGFRIELGEIENCLANHPLIRETVVNLINAPYKSQTGNRKQTLCAWFVPQRKEVFKKVYLSQLRQYLLEKLPDYMVPAYFVQMEKMPVTESGKINRKALPEPVEGKYIKDTEYLAPRNEKEKKVALIWKEILGLEKIGVYDNFFELGGDSILAGRVIARMRTQVPMDISLRRIFEHQTIDALLQDKEEIRTGSVSLKKAPPNTPIPLSFAQEGIWYLSKLSPHHFSYYVPRCLRIKGSLEVSLFEQVFTEMIRRHEILRTGFPSVGGRPVQVIKKPFEMKIPLKDLRGIPGPEQQKQVKEILLQEGNHPFDLEQGPLLRIKIIKLKEKEHILILTEHHLIHDGWTQGVLLKEFLQLFRAFRKGEPSPLPELPLQYADFCVWQRKYMKGERLNRHLNFWRKKLQELPPLLELPTNRTRPSIMSGKGALNRLSLNSELSEKLNVFSSEKGTTLFMTMLAVFKVLLFRDTGIKDLCVGTGLANRRLKETEGMLGMMINTLALRTEIQGRLSFNLCLERIKATCLEAYEYEDTPFEKVVEALQPERSLSYTPIFQVMFSFMDTPHEDLNLPDMEIIVEDSHNRSSKFDLNIVVIPIADHQQRGNWREILIDWEYNTDIFDPGMMDGMCDQYRSLLENMIRFPDKPILSFPIITEEERKKIIYEWNDSAARYPDEKVIHQILEEMVEKYPEKSALSMENKEITFKEFSNRSQHICMKLTQEGVFTDEIIGIIAEPSVEMVIGILGILKSGAAYLPIDPQYPTDRILYMVEDTGTDMLLRTDNIVIPKEYKGRALYISRVIQEPLHRSPTSPQHRINPGNLAYIIYTSGTTGRPKGVLIQHRNVVRLLYHDSFLFDFNPKDTWTLYHSFCFDFSVWELFGSLLYGGQLQVVTKTENQDPGLFRDLLIKKKVTILNLTPSAFYQLSDWELKNPGKQLNLRYIIFGGDALSPGRLKKWKEKYSGTRLINMFGITETTVHVTFKELGAKEIQDNISNIGKSLPTLCTYIVDQEMGLMPIRAKGEMLICGKGLGRGYLNQVELTGEKFIPDPFQTGSKVYCSGDWGRYMENGDIEYIGRIDNQVKIRGYRIELAEIEKWINTHKKIKQAVVLATGDLGEQQKGEQGISGDRYLYAYIVSDKKIDELELREYLLEKLPAYMVPARFFQIENIPLTVNGKKDYTSLLKVLVKRKKEKGGKPTNQTEEKLAAIWKQTLGLEEVGIQENFFNIGGDSIKVMKLVNAINEKFMVQLRVSDLYFNGTIKGLASIIRKKSTKDEKIYQSDPYHEALQQVEDLKQKILKGVKNHV